jgi:hypothetical protein
MTTETERKTIDEQEYICTQIPGTESTKLLADLTALLGGPALRGLAKAIDAPKKEGDQGGESDLPLDEIAEVVQFTLLERLGDPHVFGMVRRLLKNTRVVSGTNDDGTSRGIPVLDIYDDHFAGKLWTRLFPLVQWSVEVNYQDFYDAVRSFISRLAALRSIKGAKGSTGPRTSTSESSGHASPETASAPTH